MMAANQFYFKKLFLGIFLGWVASGYGGEAPLKVVSTTTMVSDLVREVGGDRILEETLMGPGVDPHLYKAAASDVTKLQHADIVFYNGLVLEGKMQDLFVKLAKSKKWVYAVTESIPQDLLLEPEQFEGHYDPHVWLDVTLWSHCIDTVVKGLSEVDANHADYYQKRGDDLSSRMKVLQEEILKLTGELPKEKRILVTSHDAYNYFGRAYGFQVVGLQGVSTVTEAGLADVAKLVEFIRKNNIKAIFVESSVSHATIERISRDAKVEIGGELFSDAMGTPGQMENGYDLGTYEGMMMHNVKTIVEALK
jgi:manganese/zinc/iron transport system substrate-binding protein